MRERTIQPLLQPYATLGCTMTPTADLMMPQKTHGGTACEARFALDEGGSPLNRDWKEVGGKICTAAFGLH
jgi:hypothetical protein